MSTLTLLEGQASTVTSDWVYVGDKRIESIHFEGAFTGSCGIDVSNSPKNAEPGASDGFEAVNVSAKTMVDVRCTYNWIRADYTHSANSISVWVKFVDFPEAF